MLDPSIPISADDFILEYVEKYNLEMMFEYFLSLCCVYAPELPFQFISDVAGKMILARDNEEEFKNLERVFSASHVSAVFRLFDKEQNGFVILKQYKTAMETLGLVRYNKEPDGYQTDKITEETFVSEGIKALDLLLQSFLVVASKG